MGKKVVLNNCYGGFGLSRACVERMAQLGSEQAKRELNADWNRNRWCDGMTMKGNRHCPILVRAVEELGCSRASGHSADLRIVTVKGDRYMIRSYDGFEQLVEPDDLNWIMI